MPDQPQLDGFGGVTKQEQKRIREDLSGLTSDLIKLLGHAEILAHVLIKIQARLEENKTKRTGREIAQLRRDLNLIATDLIEPLQKARIIEFAATTILDRLNEEAK